MIDSGGFDEARTCMSGICGAVEFCSCSETPAPGIRIHSQTTGNLTISYVSSAEPFRMRLTNSENLFLVWLSCSGRSTVEASRSRTLVSERRGWVGNPGSGTEISWSRDCAQLIVGIDRSSLERRLGRLLRQALPQPLAFEGPLDTASQPLSGWHDGVQLFVKSLDSRSSALEHRAAADSVEDAIMTTFLVSHRHNYWDVLQESVDLVPSRAIREATRLIESRPDHQHSVASLAHAVGVSVRVLERGFRRYLDITPHNYLRDVRLRRARQDLEVSVPDAVTVAEVARRHGFFHFGRFAATYRDRFDEAPSDTLRRAGELFG
nr:AraC family transcriptional regulator [Amycolatopsis rubida]